MPLEPLSNILTIVVTVVGIVFVVGLVVIVYHLVRFGKHTQLKNIKPYENVLAFLRRHWFVLFMQLIGFFFLGLLPVAAFFLVPHNDIFWMVLTLFYLLWLYALLYAITMYLLDVWIVTDHRVIDSEQHGFFKRTTAEIHLAKIQDVSVTITGILPTFLDYGNLEVQSAGATEKFFFQQIPHPNAIRDLIMEAHNEFIETHPNDIEIHEMGPMNTPTP